MTYTETLAVITQLRSLDLSIATNSEIKDLLVQIMAIPLPIVSLDKGNIIIRCRTVSVNKEHVSHKRIFNTYGEFSCPKRKKFFKLGRANSEDTTVLYGSIETEILNGFNTASFELLPTTPTDDDELKNLDFSTLDVVVGIWQVQKPIPLIILGNIKDKYVNLNELGHQRTKLMKDYLEKNPKNADVVKLVDSFLGEEFSKPVGNGEEYNYKISANYVDLLQTFKNVRGIIYPSVKSLGAGNNVVIFPKNVSNKFLRLWRGVYSIFYNRDNNCVNEYPLHGVYNDGKIRWEEYFEGKIPTTMRNFYLHRNEDDSFKKYIPMIDLSRSTEEKNF